MYQWYSVNYYYYYLVVIVRKLLLAVLLLNQLIKYGVFNSTEYQNRFNLFIQKTYRLLLIDLDLITMHSHTWKMISFTRIITSAYRETTEKISSDCSEWKKNTPG